MGKCQISVGDPPCIAWGRGPSTETQPLPHPDVALEFSRHAASPKPCRDGRAWPLKQLLHLTFLDLQESPPWETRWPKVCLSVGGDNLFYSVAGQGHRGLGKVRARA